MSGILTPVDGTIVHPLPSVVSRYTQGGAIDHRQVGVENLVTNSVTIHSEEVAPQNNQPNVVTGTAIDHQKMIYIVFDLKTAGLSIERDL